MTVQELMKELEGLRCPDSTIYLSRDEEGNGFRPLKGLTLECFDESSERRRDGPNAVCLWPVAHHNYEVQHPLRTARQAPSGTPR